MRNQHKEKVKSKRETEGKENKHQEREENRKSRKRRKQKEKKEDEWWMFCVNYVNHGCPTCQSFSKWHEQLF